MEWMVWGLIAAVIGLAFCIVKLDRRINRIYRKMRQINARFETLEKAAGLEQTKTDIGVAEL